MKLIGIRYCSVSPDSAAFANFLADGLGLAQSDLGTADNGFAGAVFPAGGSWIELWPVTTDMPPQTMLQLVVEDADALAISARARGVAVDGPIDAHGERIYFMKAPGGLQMSFQSKLR